MAAVVPAILEGALPESAPDRAKAVRRCIDGVGIAVAALPPASWSALHEAMGAGELERLEADLERLLQRLQQSDGALSFGVCQTCRHFLREGEDRFRCGLTQEPLPVAQTLRICREHADVEH